jgi:hypothetical protein
MRLNPFRVIAFCIYSFLIINNTTIVFAQTPMLGECSWGKPYKYNGQEFPCPYKIEHLSSCVVDGKNALCTQEFLVAQREEESRRTSLKYTATALLICCVLGAAAWIALAKRSKLQKEVQRTQYLESLRPTERFTNSALSALVAECLTRFDPPLSSPPEIYITPDNIFSSLTDQEDAYYIPERQEIYFKYSYVADGEPDHLTTTILHQLAKAWMRQQGITADSANFHSTLSMFGIGQNL